MTDPRIDRYIEKAAPFAQPILRYLRKVVHDGCPEVRETMKWSFPHFEHHGLLCSIAAFTQHCAFGFWKGTLVLEGVAEPRADAMGQFGRITSVKDLPSARTLARYVKRAAALNEQGVKRSAPARATRPPVTVPDDLAAALRKNRKAAAAFAAFTPGHQREYVEWIVEAKRAETRARRIATTVEWVAEGKGRNWKYER